MHVCVTLRQLNWIPFPAFNQLLTELM